MPTYPKRFEPVPDLATLCDQPELAKDLLPAPRVRSARARSARVESSGADGSGRAELIDSLVGELAMAITPPTADGERPALPGFSSVEIRPGDETADDRKLIRTCRLLNNYLGAATLTATAKAAPPGGWNISDPTQAAEIIQTQANFAYKFISNGLTTLLSPGSSTAFNLNETEGSLSVNLAVVGEMFKTFALPEMEVAKLVGTFDSIAKSLQDLKISWQKKDMTLDHCVLCYFLGEVQGSDTKVPYYRLYYLHVGQKSFKVGCETVWNFNKQDFQMNWVDMIFELQEERVEKRRAGIEAVLDKMGVADSERMKLMLEPVATVTESEGSVQVGG